MTDQAPGFFADLMGPFVARARAAHDAEAEHRAACTELRCARCGVWPCPAGCGRRVPAERVPCSSCAATEADRAHRRAVELQLPAAHRGATLDAAWLRALVGNGPIARATDAVDAFRVIALGPAGAGKTSLLAAMFRARNDSAAVWTSSFAIARARPSAGLGAEAPLVAACLSAPLVVVDELGSEESRMGNTVAEVIFERNANGLPTWFSSGMTAAQLAARYGGGTMRKASERAVMIVLGAST